MKSAILLFGIALLASCASPGAAPPASASAQTDENIRAATYLGRISAWKQEPQAVVQECKKIDPDGDAARRTIADQWAATNVDTLAKIDRYSSDMLPRLFPSLVAKGANPVEYFRAKTMMDLSQMIYVLTPEQKKTMCANFAKSSYFDGPKSARFLEESFAVLDQWQAAHPAGSAP